MKKIPTIFKRNLNNPAVVLNEINPACQWVFDGEGVPTRKFDGTAVLIQGGNMFKRYDCKKGRTPPTDFVPADVPDEFTGHWPGWVPVGDGPENAWFRRAVRTELPDGTYELLHPRFQGRDSAHINPENVADAMLVRHGAEETSNVERTFESLKAFLSPGDIEGIVWHHPDGRMAKIKARDFGIKRL